MSNTKLSDSRAKSILLKWPRRTVNPWPAPGGSGFWLRSQPKDGSAPGPRIASPGAKLFRTQPDGLWVHFGGTQSCDLIVVEVCGTAQNLNDKRSRYIPSSHSLVLQCTKRWLLGTIYLQGGKQLPRWQAAGSMMEVQPEADVSLPVRHLRVLSALPNQLYHKWCSEYTPTGYEFFCPHSSLDTYNSQGMIKFLEQMSIASQFRVRVQQAPPKKKKKKSQRGKNSGG